MGAAEERPEFDIKSPLGAPLLIFPRGNLLKSFLLGCTSASGSTPHVAVPWLSHGKPTRRAMTTMGV